MESAHIYPVDEVLKHFSVSESKGLSSKEVKKLQETYGPNGKLTYTSYFACWMFEVFSYGFIINTSKCEICVA
jgi:hypothetical protein